MTDNSSDKTEIIKPWQFQKGQSGNPNGRPKGTINQASLIAKDLLAQNSEPLIQKLIDLALDGDITALKICIDRICPPLKAQAQPITIDYDKKQDLTETAKHILERVTQGTIPPDIGTQLINSIMTLTKTKEIEDIHKRIEAINVHFIESKVKKHETT